MTLGVKCLLFWPYEINTNSLEVYYIIMFRQQDNCKNPTYFDFIKTYLTYTYQHTII